MATQVYKTLSKIVGIVLLLVGIGALIGGMFANSFIKSQLEDQHIMFPPAEAINAQVEKGAISKEDGEAMMQYAGETLVTGDQAKVWADNFVGAHMRGAAKRAGLEGDKANYSAIGQAADKAKEELTAAIKAANPNDDEKVLAAKTKAEMMNPLSKYPEAQKASQLQSLRIDTFLNGNTIRGMLLNAYGWGLVGKIANIAGIGLIIVGILLAAWGFVPSKKKNA
ncbi:preprotein translocase subunit Sss1 [Arcanobacterium wilhelmae]|uniref:Preprotein translocase subunit Sss1 n=1 Tax=Arcanobacterium wilhelmae TaxID=1803177 RepID=A0ABT9NBB4_9ACTO|nr:hypothetical protein [Arcanobacterium wilhelmae]MDP9800957.1 preprotein translocase subunit Sss1 [Arcanobacterium wilhelmae]WFN90317.1 hypothetical protein P8A24_00205 [Arcanobacterium wilhelmae]